MFNLLISKSSLATRAFGVYGGWIGAALVVDATVESVRPRSERVRRFVKARIMFSYYVRRKRIRSLCHKGGSRREGKRRR